MIGQVTYGHGEHGVVLNLDTVKAPEDGGTSGLDALVEAGHVGGLAAGVGHGTHVPVDAGLPDGIIETVEDVEEHGANVTAVGPVHGGGLVLFSGGGGAIDLLHLVLVTATPDDEGEGEKNAEGDLAANGAAQLGEIQGVAKQSGGKDLGEPVEQVVEGARADVEVGGVHVVLLVGVEDVGGEEHREESDDPRLQVQALPETLELGDPSGVLHHDDLGAVLADDGVDVDEGQGQDGAEDHENDKADIGAVGDGAVGGGVDVLAERDQTTNDGAGVEDDPEPTDVAALCVLRGVGHHDGALSSPQETGAETEEGTGEDDETLILGVVEAQEAGGVKRVADAANAHGDLDTEHVGEGAGEEGDNGKNGIQGSGRVVLDGSVDLATAAKAAQGVVHAGAQKADHGEDQQLNLGRGVPNIIAIPAVQLLVLPSLRAIGNDRARAGAHLGGNSSVLIRHNSCFSWTCLLFSPFLIGCLLACPRIQRDAEAVVIVI